MDFGTMLSKFAEYGPVALAFGVVLWATLKDKDRMAKEMNQDKQNLMAAYVENTKVTAEHSAALEASTKVQKEWAQEFTRLRETLESRPCQLNTSAPAGAPAKKVGTDTEVFRSRKC